MWTCSHKRRYSLGRAITMQYKYVSTKVLEYGCNGNWKSYVNPDEGLKHLENLYIYIEVYIKIQQADLAEPAFYVSLSQISSLPPTSDTKIKAIIENQIFDDNYFIPIDDLTTDIYSYVKYKTMAREQYATGYDHAGYTYTEHPSGDVVEDVPRTALLAVLPDLVVSSPRYQISLSRLHTHALLCVNGLFHQTILDNHSSRIIYIKDGGKTGNTSKGYRIGILDFNSIGPLKKFPLVDSTLTKDSSSNSYYGIVTISNPDFDLTNQQVLLCVGGFLIPLTPNVLWVVDQHTVKIDTTAIQIEKKIVEASKYLDLSSLNIQTAGLDPSTATDASLHTDAILGGFLKLSQSFLIVVPKKTLRDFNIPFRRYSDIKGIDTSFYPTDLICSSIGRVMDYYVELRKEEHGRKTYRASFLELMLIQSPPRPVDFNTLSTALPKLVTNVEDIEDQFFCISYIS